MKPIRSKPLRPTLLLPGARTPKVALGYPYGGGVTGPFLESILRLQLYEGAKPQPLLHYRLPQSGLYIATNRNLIAAKFMKTDADWLLMIDSDIEFPQEIVEMMVALAGHTKKILAASVPLGPPFPSSAWILTGEPGIWKGVPSQYISETGVQVDGLATAVILIHRDVLAAIADKNGQCWFNHIYVPRTAPPPEGSSLRDVEYISQGEDLAFCLRATEAGFGSWCAKIPGLKHHKALPMSHDFEVEAAATLAAGG